MTQWHKTDFKGVRYRNHPTKRHGVHYDRYYVITYKLDGKTKTEAVGWASDKIKPSYAFDLLHQLKKNQKTGKGPRTLAEMRADRQVRDETKRRVQKLAARRGITFKDFFDTTYLPSASARWKPETTRKAAEHVKNWIGPVVGHLPFGKIGILHAEQIRGNLIKAGLSPRSQQYIFRTFAMVWAAAQDHGLVNGPCPTKAQSFRLPKVDNERQRYLTTEEEANLLTKVQTRSLKAHDMALVALDAGLRFGEAAALTWECVDSENAALRILNTKSGRDRLVPMTNRLKDMFKSLPVGRPSDLVFPDGNGKRQTQVPSSFKRGIKDAKLNEGVKDPKMRTSFHTLRHTFASRLVQSGVDLYRVQRLLGHSTPVMTARYSKLADDDLRHAVSQMEAKSLANPNR